MMVDVVADRHRHTGADPGRQRRRQDRHGELRAPSRPPYAWMVAFAPADRSAGRGRRPDRAERRARDDITGGGLAGPIAKAVMEAVLKQ